MITFFRKHKKAVSPVIAVMLLVAVAVAAVGAYFIWFRSFQSGQQEAVREATADVIGPQLQADVANDTSYFYVTIRNRSPSDVNVTSITPGRGTIDANAGNIDADSSRTFQVPLVQNETTSLPRGRPVVFTIGYEVGDSTGTIIHTYSVVIATDSAPAT